MERIHSLIFTLRQAESAHRAPPYMKKQNNLPEQIVINLMLTPFFTKGSFIYLASTNV